MFGVKGQGRRGKQFVLYAQEPVERTGRACSSSDCQDWFLELSPTSNQWFYFNLKYTSTIYLQQPYFSQTVTDLVKSKLNLNYAAFSVRLCC